jgi:hypothetical protein
MTAFGQRLVHRDRPTEPWMPRITNVSRLGTMGVALSTCTIRGAGIRRSATSVPPTSSAAFGPAVERSNARDPFNRGDRHDRQIAQDAPGAIFSRGPLLRYPLLSTMRHRHEGDHAIEHFREVEDDVDAATPVDAQNVPTGVWKSRKEREIPTASTSIICFSNEDEERRTQPLRSTVHRIGSPPSAVCGLWRGGRRR